VQDQHGDVVLPAARGGHAVQQLIAQCLRALWAELLGHGPQALEIVGQGGAPPFAEAVGEEHDEVAHLDRLLARCPGDQYSSFALETKILWNSFASCSVNPDSDRLSSLMVYLRLALRPSLRNPA
jgi:hypothetical protein